MYLECDDALVQNFLIAIRYDNDRSCDRRATKNVQPFQKNNYWFNDYSSEAILIIFPGKGPSSHGRRIARNENCFQRRQLELVDWAIRLSAHIVPSSWPDREAVHHNGSTRFKFQSMGKVLQF